jgi:predicted GNAT superfamily acetyltransferase
MKIEKQRHPEASISEAECRAIYHLDKTPDYTRSEIAFMMESKVETVARHADRECDHWDFSPKRAMGPQWTVEELLQAFRMTYAKQPYERMSPDIYEDFRDDEMPSKTTIAREFGSWTSVREVVWGDGNG